jgi:3-phosphoshikimate 1-carboxyvinyltransferase
MDLRLQPAAKLTGEVHVPAGKSHCHRLLIAAFLAGDTAAMQPLLPRMEPLSADLRATAAALTELEQAASGRDHRTDSSAPGCGREDDSAAPDLDCGESGSTLRFLLPVTMALRSRAAFTGRGKLPQRPLSPLWEEMEAHGCRLQRGRGSLICRAEGKLHGGTFTLPGDVSSQYVTGLLLALPLTAEGGTIRLTTPLQSRQYADMTLATLRSAGIRVDVEEAAGPGPVYRIPGRQSYRMPNPAEPEGDWSAAAFWIAASNLGARIRLHGLQRHSLQGDRRIAVLAARLGGRAGVSDACLTPGPDGFTLDARDIPDLVPILALLLAVTPGTHRIGGAARLRLKESDRLAATRSELNALGGDLCEADDGLLIRGRRRLRGGTVDGCNDHRIVMTEAIASLVCDEPVLIRGAEAVNKSYPLFFDDFRSLGGIADEIELR